VLLARNEPLSAPRAAWRSRSVGLLLSRPELQPSRVTVKSSGGDILGHAEEVSRPVRRRNGVCHRRSGPLRWPTVRPWSRSWRSAAWRFFLPLRTEIRTSSLLLRVNRNRRGSHPPVDCEHTLLHVDLRRVLGEVRLRRLMPRVLSRRDHRQQEASMMCARRRSAAGPCEEHPTRRVSEALREVQHDLSQYLALMRIERANKVATAYQTLVSKTREIAGGYMKDAWQDEPVQTTRT
jgi:hypothetical protein